MSFLYRGSIQRAPRPLPQGLQVETAPASRPIDPGGGEQGAQSDGCADSNERWGVHRLMPPVLADEASVGEFVDAAERHAHSDGGDHEPVLQRVYKGGTMGLWLMPAHVVLHQLDGDAAAHYCRPRVAGFVINGRAQVSPAHCSGSICRCAAKISSNAGSGAHFPTNFRKLPRFIPG
jgi:hypothetical protein